MMCITAQTENIHMQATIAQTTLIERAAVVTGKSVSDFILDSATAQAHATLHGQTLFRVDSGQWDLFVAALDAPVASNEKLCNLLASPAPWETRC